MKRAKCTWCEVLILIKDELYPVWLAHKRSAKYRIPGRLRINLCVDCYMADVRNYNDLRELKWTTTEQPGQDQSSSG